MKNSIIKIKHTAATDETTFAEKTMKAVQELQNSGLAVEIQYQSAVVTDEISAIVYSALIIGRQEKNYGNTQL